MTTIPNMNEPLPKFLTSGLYREYVGSVIKELLGFKQGVLTMAHIKDRHGNGPHAVLVEDIRQLFFMSEAHGCFDVQSSSNLDVAYTAYFIMLERMGLFCSGTYLCLAYMHFCMLKTELVHSLTPKWYIP